MHIEGLMTKIEPSRRDELRALIQLKAGVDEKYLHPKDESLHAWVIDLFEFLDKSKENLGVNRTDNGALNSFFLKMVHANAND